MGIRGIALAHRLDGSGEDIPSTKDPGILREEAENESSHEVVHVLAALLGSPLGIVLQQLDVKAVQAAGRLDVEGVLPDLFDRGDPG